MIRSVALLCCLLPLMPSSLRAATTFHVATTGDDRNDGSAAKPFATFQQTRDTVRALRQAKPAEAVTVIVHGGTYVLHETLELRAQDSGTPDAPVAWQAVAGEAVRVSGGPTLTAGAFQPVNESDAVRARLRDIARGEVRQLDLKPFGDLQIAEYPQTFRGVPAVPELFFNDRRLNVARWPNKGWATVAKLGEPGAIPRDGDTSGKVGTFEYSGDDPAHWNVDAGVWLQGYWCYDWYDESIRVRSIDKGKRQITLDAPAVYGVRQGNPSPRRFRALNVLEELDEPGEFYIDRAARRLYLWPPEKLDAGARIVLSTLNGPLVRVKDAEHVVFSGITFEAGLGNGVEVSGGEDVRIVGCTVRNVRELGVRVTGGRAHRVERCDITDTGTGGLVLDGGDRKTLTPGGHQALDNHIWNFSRHQLTAAYGLSFGGVGNRAAHNLINDAPHQAVYIGGNDHVFELNIVRNVVTETDDAGAVYKGRNPSCRGNVIRHNYFADIGSPLGHGTAAIYFDDGDGGDVVSGNVFVRAGIPGGGPFGTVFSHGGHNLRVDNNIFVDCARPLGSVPWNDAIWTDAVKGGQDCHWQEKLLKEVDITKPPYTKKYPELRDFMKPEPAAERVSHAKDNVVVRATSLATGNWSYVPNQILSTNEDPGFVDAAKGNYELRSDSEVFKRLPGFKPIPFADIGPRQRERRVLINDAAPAIEWFAADELERYLAKLKLDDADANTVFLVGSRHVSDTRLGPQAIVLKRTTVDGKPAVVVAGGSPRATLWAVYELLERLGVRFLLDRDVMPDKSAKLPEQDVAIEPNLPVRQWRVMNAHACGPESWGMADYAPFIDQLAKLKINRLFVYVWPWHPFVHFEAGGIKRSSGTLWFGERYTITPDMPGRGLFAPKETEFWNPDLPPPGSSYAEMHAAAERLLHELMAHAKARGMDVVLVANLGEFPAEFAPLLKGAQLVQQIGHSNTIVPGDATPVDDPALNQLATAVLRATVQSYPEADFIELGMQEHRQWTGEYERAWRALDAKYGVETVRALADVLKAAGERADYPGGAERAVREVKGDIVSLYLYDRLLADGAAKRADGSQPRILFDGVAEELFPVLDRIVPRGSELLNFIDYTPSRILKRRAVLSHIPANEVPSTLIYTLHDDNVGLLPQLATGQLHELTKEIRARGWAGFSTRYWLAGDHDACVAYLAKAAWDKDAAPDTVYADHARTVYGEAAVPQILRMFAEVEAATALLEEHGLGFAFPTPQMMTQHWTPAPLPEACARVREHYAVALEQAREAGRVTSSPDGRALARYWKGRLNFGIEYLDAVVAVRRAGAAESAGHADLAQREAAAAVKHLRDALESYATVARDRSDAGAIAVMAEHAYRPLVAKAGTVR